MSKIEGVEWARLMSQAQKGDEIAYRQLLSEIYPVVKRFLIKKLGVIGADEDFVQECILTVHNVRHTFDPSRDFLPWLFAVVRNKSIDVLRKKQSQWRSEISNDTFLATIAADHSYVDRDVNVETQDDLVRAALEALPEEMRRAVVLTKIEGLNTEEASKREGITPVALRSRISRAYKIMRTQLEKDIVN